MKITVEKSRLESGDSLVEGNKALSFDIHKKCAECFSKSKGVITFLTTYFSNLNRIY